MLLVNDGDVEVIISRIIGSTDGATYVWMTRNFTIGTLGNYNTFTPTNMNFGSTNPSETLAYTWNEVGDGITGLTGGTEMYPLRILAGAVVDLTFTGDTVIPRGGNIAILAKGLGATSKGGYTDGTRREAWKHFTSPVILKKLGEDVEPEIRPNPPQSRPAGAIVALDPDVESESTIMVDGFQISTTALGT